MSGANTLIAHLESASTSVCRAWHLRRADGQAYGFTDHDCDLEFDGMIFRADSGLTARAVQQTTGLAVDNTEAVGALMSDALREDDIQAGRFDGAEVTAWLVNWQDVTQRKTVFKGTLGQIERAAGAFTAELRGLTEPLNQPRGRVFQRTCSAVLGDATCGFDLGQLGYGGLGTVTQVRSDSVCVVTFDDSFAPDWFERGAFEVRTGAATGLQGQIKRDRVEGDGRLLELWQDLRAPVAVGDRIYARAGCDKRQATCKLKFANFLNFQGFPDIPGDDWLMSYPAITSAKSGGSRR
ncbi:DUF2163 domain-containing protein [Nereida sp. MMG025]|uniref:DUF2163 domain-containing protein n=1 Tax=Nereida sp. MMG025 TaxID=2909981 RepID=UPI001F16010D|nr:DUF2163 domain-containing protein [Nereida sp. MMG025]MCF6443481.1 DUF2163 domain-containing protein [Nereida sp. MMG025]